MWMSLLNPNQTMTSWLEIQPLKVYSLLNNNIPLFTLRDRWTEAICELSCTPEMPEFRQLVNFSDTHSNQYITTGGPFSILIISPSLLDVVPLLLSFICELLIFSLFLKCLTSYWWTLPATMSAAVNDSAQAAASPITHSSPPPG